MDYNIEGLFYEAHGLKLRKFLDIKHVDCHLKNPDVMVVMMNPGSSHPIDGIDNNSIPTKACPDSTQFQIMKVMKNAGLQYCRIINLSDLRTPSSGDLYRFIHSDGGKKIDHSIFSSTREQELDALFIRGVPVVYAWGVNDALKDLARSAINRLNVKNPAGIKKQASDCAYYHALPRIHSKQLEWVDTVSSQLKMSSDTGNL